MAEDLENAHAFARSTNSPTAAHLPTGTYVYMI
jgi:hypothetical protein